MKKLYFTAFFALFLLLFGCQKNKKQTTLLMAELNPPDSIVGMMSQRFVSEVYRLSNGAVKIDLRCSGILGDHKNVLKDILSDNPTIDLGRITMAELADRGCAKARLLSIPYTFSSREHFWKFTESEIADEIIEEPRELDYPVRGIFWGEEGFRHFFSPKEITSPGDLKNLRVRISEDPVMRAMILELGAKVDSTPFSDLYIAMQLEKVDVAEQPIANYKSNYFYQVAPNLILDGHTFGASINIITEKAWKSLSSKQQQAIVQAGKIASEYCREISKKSEDEVLLELSQRGVNVVPVDDISVWQNAIKDTIERNTKIDSEFYNKILEFGR